MEKLQRSEIMASDSFQNEINGRLSLQLNHGISYGRRKHGNDSNRSLATTGESTDAEDEDPEEDVDRRYDEHSVSNSKELPNPKPRRPAVCGVCHLAPGVTGVAGVSTSPGPMLTCNQGHLLCQQCVHRYTVCSDVGCVVCGGDLQTSGSNCYRLTNCSTASHHQNQNLHRSEENSHGVQAILNNARLSSPSVQQLSNQAKNWSQNYNDNGLIFYGGNSRCTTGYSSGWDGDSGDTVQQIQTNEDPIRIQQQHQQRSYCSIRGGDADQETRGVQRIVNNAQECSRRPIRCPRLDCAVNVAFSALTHHFLFDHPEVPILSVEPGVKSTLIVSFAALSCDSSRCLALLLVSGKLTGAAARLFNGTQIQARYRNRLPLPVLAARLHCSNQNPYEDNTLVQSEGGGQGDVVIAWVAGLDVGNATSETLRCSIEAVDGNDDNRELRSLTYTGPVNSLRTAQRPREVFKTGDCVILHQGLLNHITSGCASLNVNVIVH